ncbi:MAG: efflux RND transporter periplasmic adaptor subunit [Rubrivivax sp.]
MPLSARAPRPLALAAALGAGLLLAFSLAGCGKAPPASGAAPDGAKSAAESPSLFIAPEDLLRVQPAQRAQGPVVSGSVQPARRADLRAELGAVVVQVLKDNGEAVRAGELLMRLDDTSIRDALTSAQESLRVATQGLEQAERNLQRLNALREQGMVSAQALEDAQLRRQQALGDQVAAKSRVVSAQQQQSRTAVRAPFDGVVGERRASVGDTVQVGRELVKVMDPRTMRFEGLVSADRLQELKLGQPVAFRINGFSDRRFAGTLQRIDSSVNATTRQVAVWVSFNDPRSAPAVAGLFAEGRIETGTAQVLSVPESALHRQGDSGHAWRLDASRLQKVAVKLGERDPRSGEWPVLSGLKAGDRILRNPGSNLTDGQPFRLTAPAAADLAASAASAATVTRPAAAASR